MLFSKLPLPPLCRNHDTSQVEDVAPTALIKHGTNVQGSTGGNCVSPGTSIALGGATNVTPLLPPYDGDKNLLRK